MNRHSHVQQRDEAPMTNDWGRRALIMAWIAVAGSSLLSIVRVGVQVASGNLDRIGLDYRAFVAAGELVASGRGDLLYEPSSAGFLALSDVGFVYPPWAAIFMVPWATLPIGIGLGVWTIAGLLVAFAGMRAVGVTDGRFLLLAAISFPSIFALGLGQSSFLLLGVFGFATGAIVRREALGTGVLIAAAGWKPHLLGGFALMFTTRPRQWVRAGLVWIGATAALVGASAIVIPGSWAAWITFLIESVDDLASAVLEASLPGMVALAVGSVSWVRYVVVGAVAVVMLPLVVVALRRSSAGLPERLALATAVWLLVVPHVVVYDVLLLAVPLGMLYTTDHRRDITVIGTLLAVCLSLGPWLSLVQLRAFGHALNLATIGLIVTAVAASLWVVRGHPILDRDHLAA